MKRTRSKLTPELRKAKKAYWTQKYNALNRGLVMELTFEQWYDIWITSGHWEQRGRNVDNYCMCRKGDKGNYSLGNVYIDTVASNLNDRCFDYKLKPIYDENNNETWNGVGRPPIGQRAMTNAERQRKYRAQQKEMK
jgi:hypothetical protein